MRERWPLVVVLGSLALVAAGCGGGAPEPAGSSAPSATTPSAPAAPSAPGPSGTASVAGTIRYDGDVPKFKPISMDADPGCAKKHGGEQMPETLVLGDGKTMGNVLVHVKGGLPAATWPAPAEPVMLDQQGCRYIPHVMGLVVGQKLKILNSDGLLHNVHAQPEVNTSFNKAMPATVTETEHVFDKAEKPFKIKCDVHPWMGAWVAVLPHPFFTVTAQDGRFTIPRLPAGTYEIEAWHERLPAQTATVTVADGEAATVDFTFRMAG